MNKLVYVGFSFQHHKGTHAGFNRIVNYLHYDFEINTQNHHDSCVKGPANFIDRIVRHIIRKLTGSPIFPFYILKCIWMGLTHNNLIFHFVYGENNYYNIKNFILPGNRTICTMHQPVNWFQNKKWRNRLLSLDKVTLVGNKEISIFKEITGRDNVVFVPHGISTDFYKPNLEVKKEHLLLTVGNWLRDFKFANTVYHRLLENDDKLKIVVVSVKENEALLTPHERIEFKTCISDDELLTLYLRSSLLFLPLIRYTANNSLLEAAACGCNIVIASNAQDNSYIPENYLHLCSLDEDEAVNTIMKSFCEGYNLQLSKFVEEHYSWDAIAKIMEKELRTIDV